MNLTETTNQRDSVVYSCTMYNLRLLDLESKAITMPLESKVPT